MISQYEYGVRPSAERLIRFLSLASTGDERGPILKALEAYGVLASDLASSLVVTHGDFLPCDAIVSVSGVVNQIAMSENADSSEKGIS
jgi:hypothetical protein